MASLNLGAASLISESWVVFGSTLKLRIGIKGLRQVAEKWRFRVQQMSGMEQMTKHELISSAKRRESLRQILKQYGISVESPEENKTSSRLDDLNCKEKHSDAVPSVVHDSKMNTTEELPDLSRQEKYCETVSATEDVSGQNHHLKTGALFTSSLLLLLGFCMLCIIGTIISSKTSRGHHHDGSKRTRWRTALSERDEPVSSDEHHTSPEYTISSAYHEATNEVDEACSKVEREYKRFLLECGLSES